MQSNRMPRALEERLGPEATLALVQYVGDTRKEWTAEVMSLVGDRFERRLMEENSKLRVEMAQGFAALRQEMAQGAAALRQEMAQEFSAVRQEMAAGFAALRQEIAANTSALRQEMAEQRFEILKWAFLFWVGQFFAVAGLMAVLIRFLRSGA